MQATHHLLQAALVPGLISAAVLPMAIPAWLAARRAKRAA